MGAERSSVDAVDAIDSLDSRGQPPGAGRKRSVVDRTLDIA
jgi:hypothetical protein